ncbi:hypothetical protein MSAN_02117600 [Mycena sanguinolenta]|uniref:Uncharacterized protein n=1 Tax=Mycena sanguinolenta TaxID=230812 RepID=A0A8H6XI06_9AGAR|nr:hypothetical protein MSAN_02117600 [Mycena sanguinolenta]
MSLTVTEIERPAHESLVLVGRTDAKSATFPVAWLTPSDKYVIDRAHWNKEPAPKDAPQDTDFSVEWNMFCFAPFLMPWVYGVEIAGLIIRRYFGLPGCIIPVAHIYGHPQETFVFTIAGPCDNHGKKDFYIFNYDEGPLSGNSLHRLRPAFSSVTDFHYNRRPDQLVPVPARPDKEAETHQALLDCGFLGPDASMDD